MGVPTALFVAELCASTKVRSKPPVSREYFMVDRESKQREQPKRRIWRKAERLTDFVGLMPLFIQMNCMFTF